MSRTSNPHQPPARRPARPARPSRGNGPRRPRRWLRRLIVTVLIAVLAGLGTYLLLKGPATPEPDQSIAQPDANSMSLKDAERASLFEKFTFLQPAPAVWKTGHSGDVWNMTYSDVTSCNAAAATCSTVTFANLSNPDAKAYFGNDPIKWWAQKNACKTGSKVLEGSEEFDTDGETTRYYRIPCGVEGENTVHAWFIPGKDLFVFTSTGKGGTFSVEIAKTVMDSVRWK